MRRIELLHFEVRDVPPRAYTRRARGSSEWDLMAVCSWSNTLVRIQCVRYQRIYGTQGECAMLAYSCTGLPLEWAGWHRRCYSPADPAGSAQACPSTRAALFQTPMCMMNGDECIHASLGRCARSTASDSLEAARLTHRSGCRARSANCVLYT
jgi:hypothetical protein